MQSRPNISQAQPQSEKPLSQMQTEAQEFQQHNSEATKLKLQAKHGTITPEGQERLTVLQAKMSGLLHRRLQHASHFDHNFANIPISLPDAASQEVRPDTLTPIQAKLTIGQPKDMFEREADVMARKVMSMPTVAQPEMGTPEQTHLQVRSQPLAAKITPFVQHKAMPQSDGSLQGVGEFESRLRRSKGGGSPLPESVQAFMGPRYGANVSDVRVHTGSEAVQMNQAIGALAFTDGKHIYYGAGQSPRNDNLTAHELAHTFQQSGSAVQMSPESKETQTVKSESVVQRYCRARGCNDPNCHDERNHGIDRVYSLRERDVYYRQVNPTNIGQGTGTNQTTRNYVNAPTTSYPQQVSYSYGTGQSGGHSEYTQPPLRPGQRADAGHIFGNQMGGSGRDTAAVFAQQPQYNRGNYYNGQPTRDSWRETEDQITRSAQSGNQVGASVTLRDRERERYDKYCGACQRQNAASSTHCTWCNTQL